MIGPTEWAGCDDAHLSWERSGLITVPLAGTLTLFRGGEGDCDDAAGEVTSAGTLPSPKPKPPTTVNANKWTSLAEGEAEAKTAVALRHVSSDSRDGGREGGGGGGDSGGGYRELKTEWKETLLRGSREKSSYLLLGFFFLFCFFPVEELLRRHNERRRSG